MSPTEFAVPLLSLLVGMAVATLAGRRQRGGEAPPAAAVVLPQQPVAAAPAAPAPPPAPGEDSDAVAERQGQLQALLAELEFSEQRRELVMQYAQVVFFDIDVAARSISFDGNLFGDEGFNPTGLVLSLDDWEQRVHPEDRELARLHLLETLAGKSPSYEAQQRVQRSDGSWRWVLMRGRVVERDAAGRGLRMLGTQIDIQQNKLAEQELARDRELFAHGPVVMLRARFRDGGLHMLYVSDNVRELWGYTPEQLTGLDDGLTMFHADDRDALRILLADALEHGDATIRVEARVRLPDGRYRWHKYYDMMDTLSRDRRGYLIDIDERKQAELLSAQKESQLQAMVSELRTAQREGLVLQEASDMLHSTEDLTEAFEIIRLAAERLFAGWSGWIASAQGSELVVGAHWGEDHHLPAHGFETRDCWALRRGKTHLYIDSSESVCCAHLSHLTPDERWPYLCMPMAAHGETVGSLHLYTNELVTESELQAVQARASRFAETLKLALSNLKLRASLQEQAMRDALTGLYNRRYLDESLAAELHRARRTSSPLAVAMFDVDHFKRFNDSWGHEAGDLVLQAVAQLLQAQLRSYDLACRYGGEEMAVVMPGCTAADARARLEQIRLAVSQLRLDYKGRALPAVTVSIGLTDAGNDVSETVMRRADVALYEAKRSGRNRLVVASRDLVSTVEPEAPPAPQPEAAAPPAAAGQDVVESKNKSKSEVEGDGGSTSAALLRACCADAGCTQAAHAVLPAITDEPAVALAVTTRA